jgi:serine phosphatase RsbU (regulator of sigma subunit)
MDSDAPAHDDDFQTTIVHFRMPEQATARDELGHYLVVVEGNEPGRWVEVGTTPLTIGRDARQALVYADDPALSRAHACVSLSDGDVTVEDLRSTNGTFVNAQRLVEPAVLRVGSTLRVGRQLFRYEQRRRRDVEEARKLDRDLARAGAYVTSMLPRPWRAGAVLAESMFVPSARLGGDAFGYDWLEPGTLAVYLMDVSGHGVGAAMHSVAVMNVLRQRALPGVDFSDPGAVLSSLNERYQMTDHGGMYFTVWYGVYRTAGRTLTYSSAGHHPAYLVPADRAGVLPLGEPALMIGAMLGHTYEARHTTVDAGSTVHVFSDGVFEIVAGDGRQWQLADFLPLLLEPAVPGVPEPARLYGAVQAAARTELLDDDFSLLSLTFP